MNAEAVKSVNGSSHRRLIKLCRPSVSLFGHARNVLELVFASGHQPRKRSIVSSNHVNAHLLTVGQCLSAYQQGFLVVPRSLLQVCSDADKEKAVHTVLTVLRGGVHSILCKKKQDQISYQNKAVHNLKSIFQIDLIEELCADRKPSPFCFGDAFKWHAIRPLRDVTSTFMEFEGF